MFYSTNGFGELQMSNNRLQFIIKIHVGSMPMSIQYITIYKINHQGQCL